MFCLGLTHLPWFRRPWIRIRRITSTTICTTGLWLIWFIIIKSSTTVRWILWLLRIGRIARITTARLLWIRWVCWIGRIRIRIWLSIATTTTACSTSYTTDSTTSYHRWSDVSATTWTRFWARFLGIFVDNSVIFIFNGITNSWVRSVGSGIAVYLMSYSFTYPRLWRCVWATIATTTTTTAFVTASARTTRFSW